MEYAGSTHASGACRLGSIPSIPIKRKYQESILGIFIYPCLF